MKTKLKTPFISLILMLLVCVLFALPGEISSKQISLLQSILPFKTDSLLLSNLCHIWVFLLLTIALFAIKIKPHIIYLLIVSLAVISELIQYWVPKRTSNLDDVLFDITGGVIPIFFYIIFQKMQFLVKEAVSEDIN
jgi:hypothetical protein